MPTQWSGTVEERVKRLEQAGRRCDGNSRFCTRAAVEIYQLVATDTEGNVKDGAEPVQKKACSYHRKQFVGSALWKVLGVKKIPNKASRKSSSLGRSFEEKSSD